MTEPTKKDAPSGVAEHVDQIGPTRPAMRAHGAPRGKVDAPITVTTKDDEAVEMLQAEYPGAPRWGLQVLHKVGKVEETQADHGLRIDDYGKRIGTLEQLRAAAPSMRPRSPSLTGMREEDVADSFATLSPDQQNQVVAKGIIRSRKQNYTQTGVIVSTLVALAAAGVGFMNAQTEKTRAETAREAAKAAAEAVQNAPPRMLPVAVPVQPTPTPSGATP